MPIETDWFPAWEMYGEELVGMAWSSTTAMGPDPVLELRDALQQGRIEDARWLTERLRWAHEPFLVGQDFMEFAKYNIPLEKIRVNEAGYINVGKCRAAVHRGPRAPGARGTPPQSTSSATSRSARRSKRDWDPARSSRPGIDRGISEVIK